MIARTKKLEPEPEPSLLERIHAFGSELNNWIDSKAQELKQTRDGAALPLFDLRNMLTRGDSCICRSAARMLGDRDA
jgi:hypothetical protein